MLTTLFGLALFVRPVVGIDSTVGAQLRVPFRHGWSVTAQFIREINHEIIAKPATAKVLIELDFGGKS